jgi:hypothetical protein
MGGKIVTQETPLRETHATLSTTRKEKGGYYEIDLTGAAAPPWSPFDAGLHGSGGDIPEPRGGSARHGVIVFCWDDPPGMRGSGHQ